MWLKFLSSDCSIMMCCDVPNQHEALLPTPSLEAVLKTCMQSLMKFSSMFWVFLPPGVQHYFDETQYIIETVRNQQNEMTIEVKPLRASNSVILLLSTFPEHSCQDITPGKTVKGFWHLCSGEEMC